MSWLHRARRRSDAESVELYCIMPGRVVRDTCSKVPMVLVEGSEVMSVLNRAFYMRGWPQKKLHFLLWLALYPTGPIIRWLRNKEE